MLGVSVIASHNTAGVKLISVLFRLMSLLGVRLSPKLLSKSGSCIYMVIKFSRCNPLISVICCLMTLGHTILYVCDILRSLFSMITPSPKSRFTDAMSLFVIHCSVVVKATGLLTVLFKFCVCRELP